MPEIRLVDRIHSIHIVFWPTSSKLPRYLEPSLPGSDSCLICQQDLTTMSSMSGCTTVCRRSKHSLRDRLSTLQGTIPGASRCFAIQIKKTRNKKKHYPIVQQSSRPSGYDPNDIIPARTAVFATDELLSLNPQSVLEDGA